MRYGVFHSNGVGGAQKRSTSYPDDYPSWEEADAAARKATRNATALCTLVLPLRDPVETEVDEMFEEPCRAAAHGPRNSRCACERNE